MPTPDLDATSVPAQDPASIEATLRARARKLALRAPEGQDPEPQDSYLVIQAGPLRCLLALQSIDRVVKLGGLTPLPNAPAAVAGLCYVDGQILSVIDLAQVLGKHSKGLTALVLTRHRGAQIALGIDTTLGVQELAASSLQPPPTPLQGAAARYLLKTNREGLALIEVPRLIEDLIAQGEALANDTLTTRP